MHYLTGLPPPTVESLQSSCPGPGHKSDPFESTCSPLLPYPAVALYLLATAGDESSRPGPLLLQSVVDTQVHSIAELTDFRGLNTASGQQFSRQCPQQVSVSGGPPGRLLQVQ